MKLADWVGFLCLVIALVVLWQFRQILLLIFTAVILAIALNSLVRRLQRSRLKRGQSVLVAVSLVVSIGALILRVILPPFLTQFEQLIELVPVGFEQLTRWGNDLLQNPPDWLPDLEIQLPNIPTIAKQAGPLAQNVLGNFFAFFSNSLTSLLQFLLVLILTLMFVVNPQSYRQVILRLFPSFYRRRADELFSRCEASLLQWMGGIVINSMFIATLSAISLITLQIPFVFAHALLAGVFNFVPNIGPTASVIFPVSVALLEAPWKALIVIVAYVVIQNLESYWFSPMVMQKQISLLPAATLIAQLFFARFFGFLGLVLALPLAVVMKTWIEGALMEDVLDRWQPQQQLLSDSPGLVNRSVSVPPQTELGHEPPPIPPWNQDLTPKLTDFPPDKSESPANPPESEPSAPVENQF
ncbi:MAG: AI-2E family transporter [Oscillatoriales cyanobacterium RM1_1_9]|nr:AI-2E family transporter [Oscillatoriales cyanobacterium RM1_1_9]